MEIPQTRTAKLYRESCGSQGLLFPLCRTSTSNAVKAELLKSSKTQITPVTIISVYCHLASASGAWWRRLRDWGGASSLRPSGSLTQTQFHKHKKKSRLHIPLIPPVVCTSLSALLFIVLFIKSHILFLHILLFYCFALFFILLHILHFISFFTYIYALVWCYFYIIFLFFALSTERTWFDLHFTFDYTVYNLLCDK